MAKNKLLRINYARPSFLEGAARLLDFGGALNQYDAEYFEKISEEVRSQWLDKPGDPQDDTEAIHECWVTVGNHLRSVMGMPPVDTSEKRQLRMQSRKSL